MLKTYSLCIYILTSNILVGNSASWSDFNLKEQTDEAVNNQTDKDKKNDEVVNDQADKDKKSDEVVNDQADKDKKSDEVVNDQADKDKKNDKVVSSETTNDSKSADKLATQTNKKKNNNRYIHINKELISMATTETSRKKFSGKFKTKSLYYEDLNPMQKKVVDCLYNNSTMKEDVKVIFYKDISQQSNMKNMTIQIPKTGKRYSFIWKRKNFNELSSLEKQIAKYYGGNNNSTIEFLYSYQKSAQEPWAIKIDDIIHATIWVKTEIKPSSQETIDLFLQSTDNIVNSEDVNVLIDENSEIIAKRINQEVEFRDRTRTYEGKFFDIPVNKEPESKDTERTEPEAKKEPETKNTQGTEPEVEKESEFKNKMPGTEGRFF